jgi:CheY-like chemotaxis protein
MVVALASELHAPCAFMGSRGLVLVVDDDEAIRDVVAEVLREEGYEVQSAENGEQALALMRSSHPSIVLLDLMMPVMSGWELLEQVATDRELLHIPIVVVSAMAAPGAHEHLQKPLDLDRLLTTVERICATPLAGSAEARC